MISELNFFKKIEHVLFNTNAFVITGNPLDNFIISSQNCSLYYKSSMIKNLNLNLNCCSLFIFFLGSGLIIITCENCLNKKQQVSYHVECHVDRCTSKHTHLTRGHKCGVCLEYGHGGWNHIDGKINGKVVMPSITHYSERIPEIFRTCDCKNGSVHTIEGH